MPQPDGRPAIALVGGSACDESQRRLARRVGSLIAESGAALVCGGGGGVMEAGCTGACEAGGLTLGILPGTRSTSRPNPGVDIAVYTGVGQARNLAVVLTADAVIAVGGEWGTLSEIALARKHAVPVVLLDSWGLERPGSGLPEELVVAASPEEAVGAALRLARGGTA